METLFDVEPFIAPKEPDEHEGLMAVRLCQTGWWEISDAIARDLTLGREPLGMVSKSSLTRQVEECQGTSAKWSSFCVMYCVGKCAFSYADVNDLEKTRTDITEVLAGDTERARPGIQGAREVYTTPVLQAMNQALSRAATPGGNPIASMNPETQVAIRTHLASTRLGQLAGIKPLVKPLEEQASLSLAA